MCVELRCWIGRDAVLEAIQEVCGQRGWSLLAAHLQSNPVHTVVQAEVPPKRVMNDFKAYARTLVACPASARLRARLCLYVAHSASKRWRAAH